VVLEVHPYPTFETAASGADRSKLPDAGTPPDARFPAIARATLPNGLRSCSLKGTRFRRCSSRSSWMRVRRDQFAAPGTASLALDMLDEGTTRGTALQISDTLSQLGAQLFTSSQLDVSRVALSTLKENLDPALDIFADVVLNPSFPQADFQRQQRQRLRASSGRRCSRCRWRCASSAAAVRRQPRVRQSADGVGHGSVGVGMTRDDLVRFQRTWFKPNHATLVIVGDVSLAEIQPKLTRLFSGWRAGEVPQKNVSTVADQPRPLVYILDRPGAEQSVILAADLAAPKANAREYAIEAIDVAARRAIHVTRQHEPARGETLVVRRVHLHLGRARPATVHRVCTGGKPTRRKSR